MKNSSSNIGNGSGGSNSSSKKKNKKSKEQVHNYEYEQQQHEDSEYTSILGGGSSRSTSSSIFRAQQKEGQGAQNSATRTNLQTPERLSLTRKHENDSFASPEIPPQEPIHQQHQQQQQNYFNGVNNENYNNSRRRVAATVSGNILAGSSSYLRPPGPAYASHHYYTNGATPSYWGNKPQQQRHHQLFSHLGHSQNQQYKWVSWLMRSILASPMIVLFIYAIVWVMHPFHSNQMVSATPKSAVRVPVRPHPHEKIQIQQQIQQKQQEKQKRLNRNNNNNNNNNINHILPVYEPFGNAMMLSQREDSPNNNDHQRHMRPNHFKITNTDNTLNNDNTFNEQHPVLMMSNGDVDGQGQPVLQMAGYEAPIMMMAENVADDNEHNIQQVAGRMTDTYQEEPAMLQPVFMATDNAGSNIGTEQQPVMMNTDGNNQHAQPAFMAYDQQGQPVMMTYDQQGEPVLMMTSNSNIEQPGMQAPHPEDIAGRMVAPINHPNPRAIHLNDNKSNTQINHNTHNNHNNNNNHNAHNGHSNNHNNNGHKIHNFIPPLPHVPHAMGSTGSQNQGNPVVHQKVYYYDPNNINFQDNTDQISLPEIVYDTQGQPIPMQYLMASSMQKHADIFFEPPQLTSTVETQPILMMPQPQEEEVQPQQLMMAVGNGNGVGIPHPPDRLAMKDIKNFRYNQNMTAGNLVPVWGESTLQDQSIIVVTVAVMALLVGALSARRLRSRNFLSSCIENESLEEDVAYDAAYTSDNYQTFSYKGDLEKFDV